MKNAWFYETVLGRIGIAESEGSITHLFFGKKMVHPTGFQLLETPILRKAEKQLSEYFAGKRKVFDLPLSPEGTPFEQSVWAALQSIPYGRTCSYGQIAEQIGRPKACRAVGRANGLNPIGIVIPCHRVIGADGTLTGYAGGLHLKEKLLKLEGLEIH